MRFEISNFLFFFLSFVNVSNLSPLSLGYFYEFTMSRVEGKEGLSLILTLYLLHTTAMRPNMEREREREVIVMVIDMDSSSSSLPPFLSPHLPL